MGSYDIEWSIHDFVHALRKGFDPDFELYYLGISKFMRGEMLYIGKVQRQSISDRLLGNHEALKTIIADYSNKIYIGLGNIMKKRLTEDEISDIEIALISHHKPRLNAVGVKRYKGNPIRIRNIEANDSDYTPDMDDNVEF